MALITLYIYICIFVGRDKGEDPENDGKRKQKEIFKYWE